MQPRMCIIPFGEVAQLHNAHSITWYSIRRLRCQGEFFEGIHHQNGNQKLSGCPFPLLILHVKVAVFHPDHGVHAPPSHTHYTSNPFRPWRSESCFSEERCLVIPLFGSALLSFSSGRARMVPILAIERSASFHFGFSEEQCDRKKEPK